MFIYANLGKMSGKKCTANNFFTLIRVEPRKLTAIVEMEGDSYIALCPEVDVASQGDTIDEVRNNLKEALELFFDTTSPEEIISRLREEVYVTHV